MYFRERSDGFILSQRACCLGTKNPWGDFGLTLAHGGGKYRDDGLFLLERTGPFIPRLSYPGALVVSDEYRRELEASPLQGFTFQPVIKDQIVEYHWEHWDRTSEDLPDSPEDGDPAGYLWEKPHSEQAALQMGDVWELKMDHVADAPGRILHDPAHFLPNYDIVVVNLDSALDGRDFFRGVSGGIVFASFVAKEWLESTGGGEFIDFNETLVYEPAG